MRGGDGGGDTLRGGDGGGDTLRGGDGGGDALRGGDGGRDISCGRNGGDAAHGGKGGGNMDEEGDGGTGGASCKGEAEAPEAIAVPPEGSDDKGGGSKLVNLVSTEPSCPDLAKCDVSPGIARARHSAAATKKRIR